MKLQMSSEVATMPEEFAKVIKDFVNDMKTTFPEYNPLIEKWWKGPEKFAHIQDAGGARSRHEKGTRGKQPISFQILFEEISSAIL